MIVQAATHASPTVKAELWRCKGCGVRVYITDRSLGDLARRGHAKPYCGPCMLEQNGIRNIQPTR